MAELSNARHFISSDARLTRSHAWKLYRDREGNIWVGTLDNGVHLIKDGRLTSHTMQNGLPDDRVSALYQDAEGDLWIGTGFGLCQFREGRFNVYTMQDGICG